MNSFQTVSEGPFIGFLSGLSIGWGIQVNHTKQPPIKPIESTNAWERVQIDLIDMRSEIFEGFCWIAHVMYHFSKYHIIWPQKQMVRRNQKRAAERMIQHYDTKKRKQTIEYNIGDYVTLLVDKIDRFATDMKRIPAKVIQKSGTKDIFYKIATEYGIINSKYRAGDLDAYYGKLNIDENLLNEWQTKNKTISIREVARNFNQHSTKQVNLAKIFCKCTGKCHNDLRCKCFANKIPCSSHCQNHVTGKNCKCKNIL